MPATNCRSAELCATRLAFGGREPEFIYPILAPVFVGLNKGLPPQEHRRSNTPISATGLQAAVRTGFHEQLTQSHHSQADLPRRREHVVAADGFANPVRLLPVALCWAAVRGKVAYGRPVG
jgi:hypothetical protein